MSFSSYLVGKTDFVNAGLNLGYMATGVLIGACAAYTAYDISDTLINSDKLGKNRKKICTAISTFLAGTAATYWLAPAHTMQTITALKTLQIAFLPLSCVAAYDAFVNQRVTPSLMIVTSGLTVLISALPAIGGSIGSKAVVTAGAITAIAMAIVRTKE